MEPVYDCMICKDLDPKTEFYTHTSSSSSGDDDDEHTREKRYVDFNYQSDYTDTDSDQDNEDDRDKGNVGKDDQEKDGKDKGEDNGRKDKGEGNDGKDKGEGNDGKDKEEDDHRKNKSDDKKETEQFVKYIRRRGNFRHSLHHERPRHHDRPIHHDRPSHHRRHNHRGHNDDKTRVTLPSGTTAFINKHDDMMKSFECGSKTILLELKPSDEEYKLIENEMQSTIQVHGGIKFSKYNIKKMERVINGCLMRKYRRRQKAIKSEFRHLNQRLFFHGTANADDLVAKGFDERFAKMSGMFGAGVYFAEHSSKSNQYAFGFRGQCPKHGERHCMICERKMLICRVTLGNVYKVTQAQKQIANPPPDYHSVEGVASTAQKGLKYNEYIIYRGEQAYPDYLITYNLIP